MRDETLQNALALVEGRRFVGEVHHGRVLWAIDALGVHFIAPGGTSELGLAVLLVEQLVIEAADHDNGHKAIESLQHGQGIH